MAGRSERVSLGCKLERGSCTRCTSHRPEALFINTNTHKYKYTQMQIQKYKSKQILKKEHKVHQPLARGAFHKYKYSWIKIHKYTNRQILSCLTIAKTEDDQNISATHGLWKILHQVSLVLIVESMLLFSFPMLRIVTVSNSASSLPLWWGGLAFIRSNSPFFQIYVFVPVFLHLCYSGLA